MATEETETGEIPKQIRESGEWSFPPEQKTETETGELELEQETGVMIESSNFSFRKMGRTIPLRKPRFLFPRESVPRQALAVSHNPTTLFLAHLNGFYVAAFEDIQAAALSKKSKTAVADFSFNVKIGGGVRILAVSTNNSILAASVGHQIHYFIIESLLRKASTPEYSSTIDDESSYVKDFRWTKSKSSDSEASSLILSSNRTLYHGTRDGSLIQITEDVDAVDWSPSGDSIAVGRNNTLAILSSSFIEQLTLSIPLETWTPNVDTCYRKVDSINWIRPDCILLGYSYITKDGEEVDYDIQIISCEYGQISKASSRPVVLSFETPFAIRNDLLPFGSGPHLFLNYLENRDVVLVANKKNTSEHVILFCRYLVEDYKIAGIQFRDSPTPKIDRRDDYSDNMIVGFAVDEMSLYAEVKNKSGDSQKRFPQDCILFCVTIDAKLLLFRFKDDRKNTKTRTATSDEEISGVTYQVCNSAESQNLSKTGSAVCDEVDKSRILPQRTMEEQSVWIQHLLDQAQEAMKTRNSVEGSADQYLDVWNELDRQRRSIVKGSQDLTKQILEFTSHFSTLGIKFGEDSGVGTAQRGMQSDLIPSRSCRDSLPFGTLYYTASSQLAAAEILTRQMAALNVEQPSAKWKNDAEELFDSHDLDNTDKISNSNCGKGRPLPILS